jgi:hypothetical protein
MENINELQSKIIEIIEQYSDISITAFKKFIPEISGDLIMLFPMKGVDNSNIVLAEGVNDEFITDIIDLINKDILTFTPTSYLVAAADGGELYNYPLVTLKRGVKAYKKLHWLPLLIKKGGKFNTYKA